MSQVSDVSIANQGFSAFRTELNNILGALNSMHSGTSRPASATTGTMWLDTTNSGSNSLEIKFFDGSDDISVATVDTSANTINFLDSVVTGVNIVTDTSPQLGGNLDVNGNDIVSTSNGDVDLDPNGTGLVVFKGNSTKGAGQFKLNCEVNTHGVTIKGPPHSASANYTLTLPNNDGDADQVIKTDGSGVLSFTSVSALAGSGIQNVVEDTTPQLGGDLSSNGNDINFGDNDKAQFGTGNDLQIYHNGTHSLISDEGTGDLRIQGRNLSLRSDTEPYINCTENGSVDLFHNNSKKLETTTGGVTVTGALIATGDVTAFSTSDETLKTNIENISNPIDKVMELNGVYYNWTQEAQDKYDHLGEEKEVGVIAQQVEKVLPELVGTRDDGTKAVRYDRMCGLLIECIKELKEDINKLKKR